MPDDQEQEPRYKDPRKEDIYAGDRRISRPDTDFPDWYLPDAVYRPIPIAWFAAAVLIQTVVVSLLWYILFMQSGWVTIALASLATGAIYQWSWTRGIGGAGRGWQVATALVMALQLGLIIMGVSDRL